MPEGQQQEQDVAVKRMMAFEVGIAHLCKDAGFDYEAFAKSAGADPATFGPTLAEAMIEAAEEQHQ